MKDVVVSFDKINTAHREHEHVVRRLAREFAAKIDDDEFSPADLQDYFLGRKKDPCKAVNDVMILKDETEKEKERKIRLLAKMRVRRRRDGDVGRKIKNKKKKKIEKE